MDDDYMKNFSLFTVLLLLFILSGSVASASSSQTRPDSNTYPLTGYVEEIPHYSGAYGIVGDDGKKYQPLNLPRQFRKEGLAIKFDYQRKDNVPNPINWGAVIQIANAAKISPPLTQEERSVIYVLSKRMEAFNTKDLSKLQQIDTVSRQLTPAQFKNWLGNYGNFTLRYIEISAGDIYSINGICYYTRELVNGMTLFGNTELASMTFTLSKTPDGWKLTQSAPGTPLPYDSDPLAEIKQKAVDKYGVDDLSKLWR